MKILAILIKCASFKKIEIFKDLDGFYLMSTKLGMIYILGKHKKNNTQSLFSFIKDCFILEKKLKKD